MYEFVGGDGQALRGKAHQGEETTELADLTIVGPQVTWTQQVTKPLKLKLRFEVAVNGDVLSGTVKAGALPTSKVSGTRLGTT